MDKALLQRLVGTLVTSAILYLMGVLSSHAPAFAPVVQKVIDTAGGMEVVSIAVAGAALTLLFALYRRVANYWKLKVAGQLPAGVADPKSVDQVYKQASYKDIVTMSVPSQGAARSMLIRQQNKDS